jgi:hypothetical protein
MQLAALTIAAAFVVLCGWSILASHAVDTARQARLAQRIPATADPADPAAARYAETADIINGRQYPVIALIPGRAAAAPPPGLPRWPAPGEAWLSPALLDLDHDGDLRGRYGHTGGSILPTGLTDVGELLVYYQPAIAPTAFTQRWTPISGWGGPPPTGEGQPRPSMLSPRLAAALTAVLILALASAAGARTTATGAGISIRRSAQVLAAASVGATAAAVASWLTVRFGLTLPGTDHSLAGDDLESAGGWLPILTGSAAAATTVSALLGAAIAVALRGLRRRLSATCHQFARSGWPGTLLVGSGLMFGAGVIGLPISDQLLLAAGVMLLAATPLLLLRRVADVGRRLSQRAQHPSAMARVMGRWLRTEPTALVVLGTVLVVMLTPAACLHTAWTRTDGEPSRSLWLQSTVGYQIVEISGVIDPADRARVVDLIGADHVLEVDTADRTPVLTGTCAALQQLGRSPGCPTAPTPATEAYAEFSAFGRALTAIGIITPGPSGASVTSVPTGDETPALLVLNADGAAGYRVIAHLAFMALPVPALRLPGQEWLSAVQEHQDDTTWIRLIAVLATTMTATVALFGAAASLSASSATSPARRRDVFAALVLPVATVSILAGAVALVAALAVRGAHGSGDISLAIPLVAPFTTLIAAVAGGILTIPTRDPSIGVRIRPMDLHAAARSDAPR